MNDENQEPIYIRPGDPDYKKLAPEVDALGGRPITLVDGLRFIESEILRLKKLQKADHENTLPGLADENGNTTESMPITQRLTELEKMASDTKEAIAWAESKRPGSSKKENGSLLAIEYEKETGKQI